MSSDMERLTGSILLLCLICLTNANNSPTVFPKMYSFCEDTPRGEVAFTISATDPENDTLTFSLTGPNAGLFSVGLNTGIVTVNGLLDIENGGLIKLGVVVSDGSNNKPDNLNIILLAANKNPPIFRESSYDVDIAENATIGTSLFKVYATDRDTGAAGNVRYSIDDVIPNDGLSLFNISDITGVVKLAGHLNYTTLSNFYRLKINASDGGGRCYFNETKYHSSIVYSFITVLDVPDLNPLFLKVPYIGKVTENCPSGTVVLQVSAIDQDMGINDDIIYSIEDATKDGLFEISRESGNIFVSSTIDREVIGDHITLTVKATESNLNIHGQQASTTTKVEINIIDVNDNKPEFYMCVDLEDELSCFNASSFSGEVFEHSLGFVPLNMTVKDADKLSLTELILEGADKDMFSVEPRFTAGNSSVQLLVKQPQKLDFEKKQKIVLQMVAIDTEKNSLQSTATVTITIKDTNDNIPEFLPDTYELKVAEHSPVGTIVANITAKDPDTMDQGNITYRLLPDSIRSYFDVEEHMGTVYVKNQTLLDREVRSLYYATLQAKDTDGKPGTAVLEITVTDINDQHPVFNRESYLAFVEEGGQLKVNIEATDADDPDTVNSQIVYGIVPSRYSSLFIIDPKKGVLTNSGELDREALDPELKGRIELNVTATDEGTPPLSSVVPVIINVEDINDNKPQFENSFYKFSVKEGEKGAYVGSVYAEDLDQTTDYNRISFSIIDGSFGSFIIRTFAEEQGYRGNITIDPDVELDYESARKHFKLRVEAADLEQIKAVVSVEVDVLDVNDERPEFRQTEFVTVKENTSISGAVGNFTALDKDGNHSLVYKLESMNCMCNNSLTPCSWFILEPTGEVRLNPEVVVDYEQCTQAVVEAQVEDKYTEKGENNSITAGRMVITIEDINDNAPEFIPSESVFVVVSETASKGTSVARVTVTDRDSDKKVNIKVTAVRFNQTNGGTIIMRKLFEADENGIIQTTEGLDMSLKGRYLVRVNATDAGGLSSSTVLEIFTVDESYKVELQFTRSVADTEQNRDTIIRSLTAATKASIEVVAIKAVSDEATRASQITVMVAYFVFSNGTALTSTEVEQKVSDPEHYPILADLGLRYIGKVPVLESDVDPLKFILLGVVGGLIIVLGILTTSLMCTRRNYRRKLKAAKAMKSASMVTSDNQKSGPVVPGTNKYTMGGANPVLNLNIDTAMVLDYAEESSDLDKVSLNSLDDNHYSAAFAQKEQPTEETQGESGPPGYIEPLGAALAQQGQNRDKTQLGFKNPIFSTTDL